MATESHTLMRLAERLADDEPVDWETETASDPSVSDAIGRMRTIAAIGRACRDPYYVVCEETVPPQTTTDATPELREWGPLQIEHRVGGGTSGQVFKAYDPRLDTHVALKLLRPGRARARGDRFDEARSLARVRHPHVLQVHGVAEHDGVVGIWTELIEGRTLEQHLKDQGILGADEAAQIGRSLCAALAAVHGAGLVHQDVKPANIMRENGGRIVLMDFSCVAEAERNDPATRGVGTPMFMAPEQFRGEVADERADVYSLGVVLYFLVSGEYPVPAEQVYDLRDSEAEVARVPLRDRRPGLPDAFVDTVERALEHDPDARFRSVGEMEQALAGAIGVTPPSRRWFASAAAAALLLALVYVVFRLVSVPVVRADVDLGRLEDGRVVSLEDGVPIAVGDRLQLRFRVNEPAFVYIFNRDREGRGVVLFPAPDLPFGNPVASGTTYALPGADADGPIFWEVDSAGGEEKFMVVASRLRLADLEQQLEPFERASFRGPSDFRGMSRLSHGERAPVAGSLSDVFSEWQERSVKDNGLWTWERTLENPE